MSKERPILFSGPMVRAILDGTKTQTRRIVKPQPPEGYHIDTCHYNDTGWAFWVSANDHAGTCTCKNLRQPYGKPGDRLWVRETWRRSREGVPDGIEYRSSDNGLQMDSLRYFDGAEPQAARDYMQRLPRGNRWRPSIHMPRWASRITLEVVNVRVERLNAISGEDAIAEGVSDRDPEFGAWQNPKEAFADLWESINGPGSWEANPWVWVVEFNRIKP